MMVGLAALKREYTTLKPVPSKQPGMGPGSGEHRLSAGFTVFKSISDPIVTSHSKAQMKRIHIITKSLWQIFLVFFEVVAATSLLVYASQFLKPIQDGFDIVERYILFIAVYEIFVYITLTFLNDARRDSLLALKTAFEQALFYCETGSDFVKENLRTKIAKQLDSGIFNHLDVRKEYENLLQHIESRNGLAIKYALLVINHKYEMCDLQWKFTFLLRLFK